MDTEDDTRAAYERARLLFNTNVRGPMAAGEIGLRRYFGVLETLSMEHKGHCPVFLLWRVRIEDRTCALAPDLVYWDTDRRKRLYRYDAMALRWRVLRRCHASVDGLCRSLCPEVGALGTRVCGADVSASRYRLARAARVREIGLKSDWQYREDT